MYYLDDCEEYEPEQAVCVCPEYAGAQHPVFCKACNCYTDETEELMIEAGEWAPVAEWDNTPNWPELPEIKAPAVITTPVYQLKEIA
jgi:hypothetical protein